MATVSVRNGTPTMVGMPTPIAWQRRSPMGEATAVQGDAMNLPLADGAVDLIVTSPPYFALRSYQDAGTHYEGQVGSEATPQAFLEALWKATAEMKRVLKPSGSIFVNLGDKYSQYAGENYGRMGHSFGRERKPNNGETPPANIKSAPKVWGIPLKSLMLLPHRYAIGCVDTLGLICRQDQVWSKPNGIPDTATDRVRRTHEYWLHFTKKPRYYSAQTEVPGSVWTVASEPLRVPPELDVDHHAAFPTEFPRRFILGWCPHDGVVLDPFGGSGTTAVVAQALGRSAISIDLSHDYTRLAKWRVEQSGHGSKALSRTWAERQERLVG